MEKPKQPELQKDAQERARDAARDTADAAAQASAPEPTPAKDDAHAYKGAPAIGAYGPQATPKIELSRESWEASKNHGAAWSEDPKSRLAVRLFSRGLMGAAFFTAGGLLTKKLMTGKNAYDPLKTFAEQKNPLQVIAKLIDTGIGAPIEATVTGIAGKEAGLNAVRFRPTRYPSFGKEMRGRSLGDEVVNITFDFFSASVGDAWGRDIAAWVDPNAKKGWQDDKGNFNLPLAAQNAVKAVTRYITYNGGEDWAVAIPYAYFMKGQRKLIDHASPGFQYDFDRQLNGGSFKLKDNKIVGNYNKEGLLDLQSRFTVYNIGTLMYREAYDYVGNALKGNPVSLYGAPEENKDKAPRGLLDKAGDVVKWAARSAIKGTIIMTPAVPLFWMTRTPQTKHRGLLIDPEKGLLGRPPDGSGFKGDSLHVNTPDIPSASTYVDYWHYEHKPGQPVSKHYSTFPGTQVGNIDPTLVHAPGASGNSFDAHARTFGPVDASLNVLGKANYNAAHALTEPSKWIDGQLSGVLHPVKEFLGIKNHNDGRFMRPMVYASASYTPYMYAKAEFANLWDNGKMDLGAERMVDGVAKLNWGEFKKGAHEVYRAVTFQPFEDPKREVEAQRRMLIDTSAPDAFQETQAEQKIKKQMTKPEAQPANWRDRVISAPKERLDPEAFKAKGGDGASLDDYKRTRPEKQTEQLAEREAMKKALEELHPPTNSIN